MTKEESWNRWRGRFLLFMTEAWACRKAEPSALGLLCDQHLVTAQRLHDAIFETITKPPASNEAPRKATP